MFHRSHLITSLVASLFVLSCPLGSLAEEATAKKTETINVFGEGTLSVPADFQRTKPKSSIIQHEFVAKAGEGDDAKTARVTMMGASGGVEANITRWKGQFAGGKEEDQKTEAMELGDWKVHLVDVNGTYAESMRGGPFAPGKTVKRENYAMAGAIIAHKQGRTFFVKMIGPQEVITKNRKAFVKMIKSIEK
ncbi:hypothetical protein [Planctomycetes bacterium K23_9]|uniref:Uncharacterized protein n=1 Tax=Stieleria marina TaxID=1930275 RepID=A0A517NPX2_9BACT|nr:hypothetical protein K239x_11200 [Planctomycetes bacterium K23_9]